jgi:hypothetical protein
MTLRDQYAMAALTGLLACPDEAITPGTDFQSLVLDHADRVIAKACERWGHVENLSKRGHCLRCERKVPELCAEWRAQTEAEARKRAAVDETIRKAVKRMEKP